MAEDESGQENQKQESSPQNLGGINLDDYVPKSKVDEIVNRNRASAAEKARREAEQQYQAELEKYRQAQSADNPTQEQQQMQAPNIDEMYKELQERFARDQQRAAMQQQVAGAYDKYLGSMRQGSNKYDDFEQVTKEFNAEDFPELVFLVSDNVDEPDRVMYELLKNPTKLTTFNELARSSPKYAISKIQELNNSILQNVAAQQNNKNAPQPLSQLQTSPTTGTASGDQSLSELKKADWLRG